MDVQGFILQPSYRIEQGRPVVHLFGVLETGHPFVIRDHSLTSHFWIRARDVERALALGVTEVEADEAITLDGYPASRVEVPTPPGTPAVRDLLSDHGVPTYEADVRFAMRFLIERGIRGSLRIRGEAEESPRGLVFESPDIAPSDWTPSLRVLSVDIETDPKARRLLSIALVGCDRSEVLLFCPKGFPPTADAIPFDSEAALLRGFVDLVREIDPDVLTGWNVVDFDFAVLERLGKRLRVPLALGRGGDRLRLRPLRASRASQEALIPGRLVLDGIQLLRGASVVMPSYGLDAVAREVLGHGKTLTTEGDSDENGAEQDRGKAILDAFKHHRERFVAYNRNDAQLVLDILDRLGLIALGIERSKLTGLPLDRIAGSIAAFDFLYLQALHTRGTVAPSVRDVGEIIGSTGSEVNLGGHVFEPKPGLYDNVLVFDFKSLYPSVIRTFQVDPIGYLDDAGSWPLARAPAGPPVGPPAASPVLRGAPVSDPPDLGTTSTLADAEDSIVAPNGARFRRARGILTEMLDELFPRREAAKKAGDAVASQAIKILMNSFYGVLGTSACRFHRPQLAGAITAFGRALLHWTKERFERDGHEVLYGDTDSLFVLLARPAPDPETTLVAGEDLRRAVERDLAVWIAQQWRVESRLELELETCYRRLLLMANRGGSGGARKRYAGLVGTGDQAKVVFTGMESVRSDWTAFAKDTQRALFERLFHDRAVERYLREQVAALRAGEHDTQLVYRKQLRKPLDAYTATTPPHVAAARKLPKPPRRTVRYVMTVAGPEPTAAQTNAFDYEHYVDKQVRPVAEPVLAVLGLDFDRVIGDDTQLGLFDP